MVRRMLFAGRTRVVVTALAMLGLLGCGYSLHPPFSNKIQTVFVSFKNVRFRRDMQLQFTELLIKEIERRTPYKVVGDPEAADAQLTGTITFDDKFVFVENPNNFPRHIQASLMANVTFTDNRTGKVSGPTLIADSAPFYPEIGETAQLGFEKVMDKMVREIVGMMEQPWGREYAKKKPDVAPDIPEIDPTPARSPRWDYRDEPLDCPRPGRR